AVTNPVIQQVSTDAVTGGSGGQHQTEVEPDTFSYGSTVVASFQVGRTSSFGAVAMGWATSTDNGQTWAHGVLPGLTASSPNPNPLNPRVVNQSVAYDSVHSTWLVMSVGIVALGSSFTEKSLLVSRSSDGLTWQQPVTAVATDVDKAWGVCDNWASSPFRGHCYVAYSEINNRDTFAMVSSTDGGKTWSPPLHTPTSQRGYNTNPVVQPNGRVVVVGTDVRNGANGSALLAFGTSNGGVSLTDPVVFNTFQVHNVASVMRSKDKPSADIDQTGTVYAAWSDCRFRSGCPANDIVFAKSSDGTHWTSPIRVAEDPVTSGIEHFIPGMAVRPGTSGSKAELGVMYYSLPVASCTTTCVVNAFFDTSTDGGATWHTPTKLNSAAMQPAWMAATGPGRMVGDVESVSYGGNGAAVTVFAVATAPVSGSYREAMNAATFAPLTR
ncbi:MAG: sialidase family protein, partial [Acidimicrobiales bacterium]